MEAIRVALMLKRSRIKKLKSAVVKFEEITKALVVDPVEENIIVDIKMQVPENKGTSSVDQPVQAAK